MNIKRTVYYVTATVILVAGLTMAQEVLAQDEFGLMEEPSFEIGSSCAGLAYMSAPAIKAFVSTGYADDFHSFCYPEEPSECSDYTPFMKGLGRLTTGDDGYHCSLQLQF